MSNLTLRIAAGVLLALGAFGAAWLGGTLFAGLAGLVAVAIFWEWRRMTAGWGPGWTVAGFFYALIPALAILWVRDRFIPGGFELVMWVFLVTWAVDVGAYAAGRAIGGPKLAPRISPNKTWAGLAGGVLLATLASFLWTDATQRVLPATLNWLAPLFAVAAQGGDLFESALKRRAGVKDSSNILPGHGGVMDRVDGLVVVAVLTAAAMLAGIVVAR